MSRLSAAVSVLLFGGALASSPAEGAQRVFVASYGNDANTATGCGFANPCRGFTAAMTAVDAGGEVVALDAAGYGAVTITKSVISGVNITGVSVAGIYCDADSLVENCLVTGVVNRQTPARGSSVNSVRWPACTRRISFPSIHQALRVTSIISPCPTSEGKIWEVC